MNSDTLNTLEVRYMNRNVCMYYLTILSSDSTLEYMTVESWELKPGWNFLSTDFAAQTYKTSGYSIAIL